MAKVTQQNKELDEKNKSLTSNEKILNRAMQDNQTIKQLEDRKAEFIKKKKAMELNVEKLDKRQKEFGEEMSSYLAQLVDIQKSIEKKKLESSAANKAESDALIKEIQELKTKEKSLGKIAADFEKETIDILSNEDKLKYVEVLELYKNLMLMDSNVENTDVLIQEKLDASAVYRANVENLLVADDDRFVLAWQESHPQMMNSITELRDEINEKKQKLMDLPEDDAEGQKKLKEEITKMEQSEVNLREEMTNQIGHSKSLMQLLDHQGSLYRDLSELSDPESEEYQQLTKNIQHDENAKENLRKKMAPFVLQSSDDLEIKLKQLQKSYDELSLIKNEKEELEAKLNSSNEILNQKQKELEMFLEEAASGEKENEITKLKSTIQGLENQVAGIEQLNSDILEAQNEIVRLQNSAMSAAPGKKSEFEDLLKGKKDALTQLNSQLAELNSLSATLAEEKKNSTTKTVEIGELKIKQLQLEASIIEIKKIVKSTEDSLTEQTQRATTAESKLKTAGEQLMSSKKELSDEIAKLNSQIEEDKKSLDGLLVDLSNKKSTSAVTEAQLKVARQAVDDANTKLEDQNRLRISLQEKQAERTLIEAGQDEDKAEKLGNINETIKGIEMQIQDEQSNRKKVEALTAEQITLHSEVTQLRTSIQTKETDLKKAQDNAAAQLTTIQTKETELKQALDTAAKQLSTIQTKETELKQAQDTVEDQGNNIKSLLSDLELEKAKPNDQSPNLKNIKQRSRANIIVNDEVDRCRRRLVIGEEKLRNQGAICFHLDMFTRYLKANFVPHFEEFAKVNNGETREDFMKNLHSTSIKSFNNFSQRYEEIKANGVLTDEEKQGDFREFIENRNYEGILLKQDELTKKHVMWSNSIRACELMGQREHNFKTMDDLIQNEEEVIAARSLLSQIPQTENIGDLEEKLKSADATLDAIVSSDEYVKANETLGVVEEFLAKGREIFLLKNKANVISQMSPGDKFLQAVSIVAEYNSTLNKDEIPYIVNNENADQVLVTLLKRRIDALDPKFTRAKEAMALKNLDVEKNSLDALAYLNDEQKATIQKYNNAFETRKQAKDVFEYRQNITSTNIEIQKNKLEKIKTELDEYKQFLETHKRIESIQFSLQNTAEALNSFVILKLEPEQKELHEKIAKLEAEEQKIPEPMEGLKTKIEKNPQSEYLRLLLTRLEEHDKTTKHDIAELVAKKKELEAEFLRLSNNAAAAVDRRDNSYKNSDNKELLEKMYNDIQTLLLKRKDQLQEMQKFIKSKKEDSKDQIKHFNQKISELPNCTEEQKAEMLKEVNSGRDGSAHLTTEELSHFYEAKMKYWKNVSKMTTPEKELNALRTVESSIQHMDLMQASPEKIADYRGYQIAIQGKIEQSRRIQTKLRNLEQTELFRDFFNDSEKFFEFFSNITPTVEITQELKRIGEGIVSSTSTTLRKLWIDQSLLETNLVAHVERLRADYNIKRSELGRELVFSTGLAATPRPIPSSP